MAELQQEYIFLFNAVSRCIEQLRQLEMDLIFAQQLAEQLYIDRIENA